MRLLAAGVALAALGGLAGAAAQTTGGTVLVVASFEPGLGEHRRVVERAVTRALGTRLRYRPWRDDECLPGADPTCAAALLRGTDAIGLVHAHVGWARAGCAPERRDGEIVGHRVLRAPVLELDAYDPAGARVTGEAVDLSGPDAPAAVEAALRAISP